MQPEDDHIYMPDSDPVELYVSPTPFPEEDEESCLASQLKLATSHPQNIRATPPIRSGMKRKVSTARGKLDRVTSNAASILGNHDGSNDGNNSDLPEDIRVIASTQRKKAKIQDEPIEIEESDVELDGMVMKMKPPRKLRLNKKNSDEEEGITSYKNSMLTNFFDMC